MRWCAVGTTVGSAGCMRTVLFEDDRSIEIDVEAETFDWIFQYPDGAGGQLESRGELVLPGDTSVRLRVTSTDVWHSFGVTERRLKADAIPGEYDSIQFRTDPLVGESEREFLVECFELCGEGHDTMTAEMRVVPDEEYDDWFDQLNDDAPEERPGVSAQR